MVPQVSTDLGETTRVATQGPKNFVGHSIPKGVSEDPLR